MKIHPIVTYTVGRFALMVGVAVLLFAVGFRNWMLVLLAVAISMPLSWFLLRKQREQLGIRIAAYQERRRAERAELDDALEADELARSRRKDDDDAAENGSTYPQAADSSPDADGAAPERA